MRGRISAILFIILLVPSVYAETQYWVDFDLYDDGTNLVGVLFEQVEDSGDQLLIESTEDGNVMNMPNNGDWGYLVFNQTEPSSVVEVYAVMDGWHNFFGARQGGLAVWENESSKGRSNFRGGSLQTASSWYSDEEIDGLSNILWHMRYRVDFEELNASVRIWQDGDMEPEGWNITKGIDESFVNNSAFAGIFSSDNRNPTFHAFSVGVNGASAPTSKVSELQCRIADQGTCGINEVETVRMLSDDGGFNNAHAQMLGYPFVYVGSQDGNVRRLMSTGLFDFEFSVGDNVRALSVDDEDNIYVGRNSRIQKYDVSGNLVWEYYHGQNTRDIEVSQEGFVTFATSSNSGPRVQKLSPEGVNMWNFSANTGWVESVAFDREGNVYSGDRGENLIKIDSTGEEVWRFTGQWGRVLGIALTYDNEYIYRGGSDNRVRKINQSGEEVWSFSGHSDRVWEVAVDLDNNVYSSSADGTVRKIDGEGNEVWVFDGHSSRVRDVVVDSDGFVYSSGDDGYLFKIDQNGEEVWNYSASVDEKESVAVLPGAFGSGFSDAGRYDHVLCCSSANQNLGNSCGVGNSREFLRLNAEDNAHVQVVDEELSSVVYDYPVCVAGSEGSTVCEVSADGNPDSDLYACMGSLASSEENSGDFNLTNAHIAGCGYYDTEIYCRLNNPPLLDGISLESSGENFDFDNFTMSFGNVLDIDGDTIGYFGNWMIDSSPLPLVRYSFLRNPTLKNFEVIDYGRAQNNIGYPEFGPEYIEGRPFGALMFNSTSDSFLDSGERVVLDGNFTVSFWMKPVQRGSQDTRILSMAGYDEGYGFRISSVQGDGRGLYMRWRLNEGGDTIESLFSNTIDFNSQWQHYVGVFEDEERIRVYKNANLVGTITSTGSRADSSNDLKFGFSDGFENKAGLGEIMIFNQSISEETVFDLYQQGLQRKSMLNLSSEFTKINQTITAQGFVTDLLDTSDIYTLPEVTIRPEFLVELQTPSDGFLTDEATIEFSCQAQNNNGVDNLTLTVWDSNENIEFNQTVFGAGNNLSLDVMHNLSGEGNYLWGCTGSNAQDTRSALEGNRTLSYFTDSLNIEFISPTPSNGSILSVNEFDVRANIFVEVGLDYFEYGFNDTTYTVFDENLVLLMNFDDVAGLDNASFAYDNSLYGNHGEIFGASWSNDGVFNGALEFDGDNDYVSVGSVGISGDEARTISGWAKTKDTSQSSWTNIFGFGGGSSNDEFFDIQVDGAGTCGGNGYILHIYRNQWCILNDWDTQWHHLAATYDGSRIKAYLNGEQVVDVAYTGLLTVDNIRMGNRNDNNNYFDGFVDEVRVWNRSLSSEEISQVYRSNLRRSGVNTWDYTSNHINLPDDVYNINVSGESNSLVDNDSRVITISADKPTPITPIGEITHRTPMFEWSSIDGADSYDVELTPPSGVDCFGFNETVSSTTYEVVDELCTDLDYDSTSENYTWQVRACSGGSCGDWSSVVGFDVLSVNSIELVEDSVDFGTLQAGDNVSTAGGISPMRVRNLGNIRVDVEGSANESLFDEASLGSNAFQFFSNKTIDSSFDEELVSPAWLNVSGSNQNLLTQLEYGSDAFIHYRVSVPSAEEPGSKQSGITVESVPND